MARLYSGRRLGLIYTLAGAGILISAAIGMGELLMPRGASLPVLGVWWLSLTVILIGLVIAGRDVLRLSREWRTLEAAENTRDYVSHVADSRGATARLARRIAELKSETGAALQGVRTTLRAESVASLSDIGASNRFFASVLLLLAVVGTFAGMKAALPHLIDAIGLGSGPTPTTNPENMKAALREVANAFGTNFIALLGSLTLGLAAYGLQSERRGFLTSLERFASRSLYNQLPLAADATAIEQVVRELKSSVGEIVTVSRGIGDLRTSINAFQRSLSQAIGGMQEAFTGQFQRDLLDSQRAMRARSDEISVGVQDIATALATTALAYQGLVEGLRERDYGLGRAAAANISAMEQVSETNTKVTASISDAAATLNATGERLTTLASALNDRSEAIEAANTQINSTIANGFGQAEAHARRLSESLDNRTQSLEIAHRETASVLETASEALSTRLERLHTEIRGHHAASREGADGIASAVMRGSGATEASLARLRKDLEALTSGIADLARSQGATAAATVDTASQTQSAIAAQTQKLLESYDRHSRSVTMLLTGIHSLGERTGEAAAVNQESVLNAVVAARADLASVREHLVALANRAAASEARLSADAFQARRDGRGG